MRGPELYGREPQRVRWSADGRVDLLPVARAGTDWREPPKPYRVRAGARLDARARHRRAGRLASAPLLETGDALARPDDARRRRRRAISTSSTLQGGDRAPPHADASATSAIPQFSADGKRVFFVRDDNVCSLDLDGGLRSAAHRHPRRCPAPKRLREGRPGSAAPLEAQQQRAVRGHPRSRARRQRSRKAERKAREAARSKPLYLARQRARHRALRVARTASAPAHDDDPQRRARKQTRVPNYVTVERLHRRARSSARRSATRRRRPRRLHDAADGQR